MDFNVNIYEQRNRGNLPAVFYYKFCAKGKLLIEFNQGKMTEIVLQKAIQ